MLPQQLNLPAHEAAATGALAGFMVNYAIILKAVCAALVSALAGADLRGTLVIHPRGLSALGGVGQSLFQGRKTVPFVGLARSALRRYTQPARQVRKLQAILMLVPVLPAAARAAKPPERKVALINGDARSAPVNYGTCNGAGVDAPTPFSWRNSLNPVAASLIAKLRERAFQCDCRPTVAFANAVLSTLCVEKANVGARQVSHEELGVITALGGAEFNLHRAHVHAIPHPDATRKGWHAKRGDRRAPVPKDCQARSEGCAQ